MFLQGLEHDPRVSDYDLGDSHCIPDDMDHGHSHPEINFRHADHDLG